MAECGHRHRLLLKIVGVLPELVCMSPHLGRLNDEVLQDQVDPQLSVPDFVDGVGRDLQCSHQLGVTGFLFSHLIQGVYDVSH